MKHGTFTSLVFLIYGSMLGDFTKLYYKLAGLVSDKHKQSNFLTVNWLRTKICLGLLEPCLLCLRGSRSINRNIIKIDDNMTVANELALMN